MKVDTPTADALIAQLPDDIRPYVRATRRIDYHAQVAVQQQNWTIEQLAAEAARNLDNVANIGAVIDERIAAAATVRAHGPRTKPTAKRPFCSPECRDNQGLLLDPTTRLPVGKCQCRKADQ